MAAGNPPDVAALPNPGQMREFAAEGALVDLSRVLDVDQLRRDYAETWIDLGSYDGKLYAIHQRGFEEPRLVQPEAVCSPGLPGADDVG